MTSYDTMSEAIAALQQRGYTYNFNLDNNCLLCEEKEIYLHPQDFEVDEAFRFEGDTDPGDENVVYAISSVKHDLKGILVNAFGTYSELESATMISKLKYSR